jgi:membrane protease YdiL (CAAX protease family)
MQNNRLSAKEWIERVLAALLFIAIGSLIMIFFNPWGRGPLLGGSDDYLAKIGSGTLLLIAALLVRRSKRFEKYWQLLFALFIMDVVISLDLVFGIYGLDYLHINGNSPVGFALSKLNECFAVVGVIITFTILSGGSLGSIYIQKGNLKQGLLIGGIAFLICIAGSIPMASLMFKSADLGLARIIPWIPWLLISVLANGALEELWFRGLFLRKLQPFFGKFISIFLIAFVFTLMHGTVTYTLNNAIFLAVVFPLALIWGYVMQKTEGVWASILFHAGTDIPIFLSIFSNFK